MLAGLEAITTVSALALRINAIVPYEDETMHEHLMTWLLTKDLYGKKRKSNVLLMKPQYEEMSGINLHFQKCKKFLFLSLFSNVISNVLMILFPVFTASEENLN